MGMTETRRLRALLRELVRRLSREEIEASYGCGLTFTECHTLLEIADKESTTVGELTAALDLDKSTLSRSVASLVRRRLIQRREHPGDRRVKVLQLTQKGDALRREIDAHADERFGRALKSISEESREPVLEYLGVLVRSLKDDGDPT